MKITPFMTRATYDDAIEATEIGMAHIAGTGPAGRTCRECIFWRKYDKELMTYVYPEHGSLKSGGQIKKAFCQRSGTHPHRLISHSNFACRLFVASDVEPPPATRVEVSPE